jgi:uncharacterized protein (TIGR03083 family)
MPSVTSWLIGFMFSVMTRGYAPLGNRPEPFRGRAAARNRTDDAEAGSRYLRGMAEIGIVYGAGRERFAGMLRELDKGQLATRVAATADWTVHDVVAHLVGVVTDVNAGKLDGIGSEACNAAQVAERRDGSISDLIAEWEQGAPQFEATITAFPGVHSLLAVADLWNHEQDVRGTLGIEGGHDPLAEHMSIEGYAGARVGQFADAGLAPLQLRSGVDEWLAGEGTPGATVTAEPYELARLICERRTAEQARAYRWEGDPEPYVALLTANGPSEPLPT